MHEKKLGIEPTFFEFIKVKLDEFCSMSSNWDGKLVRQVTRRDGFSFSSVNTAIVFGGAIAEKNVRLSSTNEITH